MSPHTMTYTTMRNLLISDPGLTRSVFVISCSRCKKLIWLLADYKRAAETEAEQGGWRLVGQLWFCSKCHKRLPSPHVPVTSLNRPKFLQEDHLAYLDQLRDSGRINMLGAIPFMISRFNDLTRAKAGAILLYWIGLKEAR
jgi:hypothetical protein